MRSRLMFEREAGMQRKKQKEKGRVKDFSPSQ